jgi:hypothetical protein
MIPLLLIQLSTGAPVTFKPIWALGSNQLVGPIAPQPVSK